jgi:hypothetical protein
MKMDTDGSKMESAGARKPIPAYSGTYLSMFYDEIIRLTEFVRDRQVPSIVSAMTEAYQRQSAGGTIYSHVLVGHFAMFAASPGIPGQPSVLAQRADRNVAADYNNMKEGDFLLTNGPSIVNPTADLFCPIMSTLPSILIVVTERGCWRSKASTRRSGPSAAFLETSCSGC